MYCFRSDFLVGDEGGAEAAAEDDDHTPLRPRPDAKQRHVCPRLPDRAGGVHDNQGRGPPGASSALVT